MKKSDIFLVLVVLVVMVLGFFVLKGKKVEPDYVLPLTLSGEAGLHELSYQEYKQKVDNNEKFVVIVERATCSHCQNFLPVAEEFAKSNALPMYYVDTDTFSDEEWGVFESTSTFFKKKAGNWGTPTTIVASGRNAIDYIEGETDSNSLLELYKKYFEMGE